MVSKTRLNIEERKKRLDDELLVKAQAGWRVISRSDTTAQIAKKKDPNALVFILLLLILALPAILYLGMQNDIHMYLTIDEYGQLETIAQN